MMVTRTWAVVGLFLASILGALAADRHLDNFWGTQQQGTSSGEGASDTSPGALAVDEQLVNLGRVLQQQTSSGALDTSSPDVPDCLTPWEIFNSTAELSFWAEALQTVGFADEVHSPYITATFLVPTNDAFAALLHSLGATKQQLLSDPSIVPILLYHMLPGAYMAISDFALGDSLSTAVNLNLTVGAATAPLVAAPGMNRTVVTVQSAQSVADIVRYNMTACMAIVHEINQVLVPEFLGADSGASQVVYHLGDGSGSHAVVTNFTLVLPSASDSQKTADAENPLYQITEAGLMFSVSSTPV